MEIKQYQHLLAYLGFYGGDCDGIIGRQTTNAVRSFQSAYGLDPDGVVGRLTEKALRGAVAGTLEPLSSFDQLVTDTIGGDCWSYAKHWTRNEFRCTCGRCGGFPVEPTDKLVRSCEDLRLAAGVPLYIVDRGGSGVRCKEHNAEVGGAKNSNHLYGKAADIHSDKLSPQQLYDLAQRQLGNTGELGIYSWGIHFAPEGKYSRFKGD